MDVYFPHIFLIPSKLGMWYNRLLSTLKALFLPPFSHPSTPSTEATFCENHAAQSNLPAA